VAESLRVDRLLDNRPKLVAWLLATLVVLSVALRVWDASGRLQPGKTFDERFSVANVTGVLAGKGLAPRQAYYPSLSYLPQAAVLWAADGLHRVTGVAALDVQRRGGRLSRTGYLLCRLTNVAFGAASLVMVFVVGRRLFGSAEGLAAAAVLAAFRRHVISSAHFKPDILVLLLTVVTFHWALLCVWRPRRRAYLRAGFGVGLATAAKYTGAGAALAVVAAALVRWRDRRQLGWLVLAGVTAVATFVVLNPWLGDLYRFLRELVHGYSLTGVEERTTPWVVLRQETASVLSHHGWPALFVVIGLVALAWRVARPAAGARPWSEEQRLGAILLLVQTVGYALAHAAVFPAFRAQNILPIAPFTSLLAGWAMVETYRWAARRWQPLQKPAVGLAVGSIAAMALAIKPGAEVYERAVPTTWDAAATELAGRLETPALRSVVYYGQRRRFAAAARHHGLAAYPARGENPAHAVDAQLADAEVFAADSPPRAAAGKLGSHLVSPRAFVLRGEGVGLRLHPWRLGDTDRLSPFAPSRDRLVASLPPTLTPGTAISIALSIDPSGASPGSLVLQPSARRLPLVVTGRRRGGLMLMTRRFLLAASEQGLEVALPSPTRRPPRIELYRWEPPARADQ